SGHRTARLKGPSGPVVRPRQAAALFLIAPIIAVSMAPPAPPAIACEMMPSTLRLPDCAAAVIAGSNKALPDRAELAIIEVGAGQQTDQRYCSLLRPRRERPRSCSAAEQRDERAPPHSITSSARASRLGGTSKPSALAVLRLITSSNRLGRSIGR